MTTLDNGLLFLDHPVFQTIFALFYFCLTVRICIQILSRYKDVVRHYLKYNLKYKISFYTFS